MNRKWLYAWLLSWGMVQVAVAQGTFVYDQQSADESNLGGGVWDVRSSQPMGQSFTPGLSSIGFVRLYLSDAAFNGLGTTFRVDLLSGSITGSVVSSTSSVAVPDGFHGPLDFLFATSVPVTAGATYYFRPVVESGESFGVYAYNTFNYSAGTAFAFGATQPAFDLWFREGIIVPEPSWTALVGLAVGAWFVRRCGKSRQCCSQGNA